MNFQDCYEKNEFLLSFCRAWENFTFFFDNRNAILMTTSCVFKISDYVITFWYSHLHVLTSELIQTKLALSQRCSAVKAQCFRAKKISTEQCWFRIDFLWYSAVQLWMFQFWIVLTQRKSEDISSDVFHNLWISAEKRQTIETAMFSADYLWASTRDPRDIPLHVFFTPLTINPTDISLDLEASFS